MFAGIVEARGQVLKAHPRESVIEIEVVRPSNFSDLHEGDSIAVNGICLTIEAFDEKKMTFAVAAETLQVTKWTEKNLVEQTVNLERSLEMGARIHGHFVTGHVDAVVEVVESEDSPEKKLLKVAVPSRLSPMIWKKGSVALNGVSLTVNEVGENWLSVCLIPETLRRTNLGLLTKGSLIMLEVDWMARGLVHNLQQVR